MTQQDDRLSLEVWVSAMSAYQHVEIFPRDEPKEIKVAGKSLGTFPRTGDEQFSWLLRKKDQELRAFRTRTSNNLKAHLLVGDSTLYACRCGIISVGSPNKDLRCMRCWSSEVLLGHYCRSLPRRAWVSSNVAVCLFCNERAGSSGNGSENRSGIDEATDGVSLQGQGGAPRDGPRNSFHRSAYNRNNTVIRAITGLAPFLFVIVSLLAIYFQVRSAHHKRVLTHQQAINNAIETRQTLFPVSSSLARHCSSLASLSVKDGLGERLWTRCVLLLNERVDEALEEAYSMDRRVDGADWAELTNWWDGLVPAVCDSDSQSDTTCTKFSAVRELLAGEAAFQATGSRRSEDLKKALSNFRNARRLDPDWSLPHYRMGNVYLKQSEMMPRPEEKIRMAKLSLLRARHFRPRLALIHYHLNRILLSEGAVEEAMTHLQNAITIEPQNLRFQRQRFRYLIAHGHCHEVRAVQDSVGTDRSVRELAERMVEEACNG